MSYELPFRSDDFADDEYVVWTRDMHSDPGHIQEWGYDLGGVRFRNGVWSEVEGKDKYVPPSSTASEAEKRTKAAEWNGLWHLYGKPVYAMKAGTLVAGWRNAPENNHAGNHPEVATGRIYGGGNGMWILHDDGTLCEYAHFMPGSVPADLVPHDAELLPQPALDWEGKPSNDVADCWDQIYIPPTQQVSVEQGQFLGRVGNTGTSSNTHLHIHTEAGSTITATSKSGGTAHQMTFARGLASQRTEQPDWSPFVGQPIPHGPDGRLIWPPLKPAREYARHGLGAAGFQDHFDHVVNSGFQLEWLDTYTVGGDQFMNQVWHPAESAWRARVLRPLEDVQDEIAKGEPDGLYPVLLESCKGALTTSYSVILREGPAEPLICEFDLSYDQHMEQLNEANKLGVSPVSVSVTPSVLGERRYSVLYRKVDLGKWSIRSQIPEDGFQDEFDKQDASKKWPVYMSGYMLAGTPFLSVVFAEKPAGTSNVQFAMSGDDYQQAWRQNIDEGLVTGVVTAFDGAKSQHRFAARWWDA